MINKKVGIFFGIPIAILLVVFVGVLFIPVKIPFVAQGIMTLSFDQIEIFSPNSGIIQQVYVEKGNKIHVNQPLLKFRQYHKVSIQKVEMYNMRLIRLQAELDGKSMFTKKQPYSMYKTERQILKSNQRQYHQDIKILVRHIHDLKRLYDRHHSKRIGQRLRVAYLSLRSYRRKHANYLQEELQKTLHKLHFWAVQRSSSRNPYIFSNTGGRVQHVYVRDNQLIHKGNKLLLLDHQNSTATIVAEVSSFEWHQIYIGQRVNISYEIGLQNRHHIGKVVKIYKKNKIYKVNIAVGGIDQMHFIKKIRVNVSGTSDATMLWQQMLWLIKSHL